MGGKERTPECHPDRPHGGRGLCRACYMKAYRTGQLAEVIASEARPAPCHPERRYWAHDLCKECYEKEYREQNAERKAAYIRKWREANPEKVRAYKRAHPEDPELKRERDKRRYYTNPDAYWGRNLTKKYGITAEEYARLLREQDGKCAICGVTAAEQSRKRARLDVDHDHVTGKPRGLLCNTCNQALGRLRDDPDVLRKAAAYIEHHHQPSPPSGRGG